MGLSCSYRDSVPDDLSFVCAGLVVVRRCEFFPKYPPLPALTRLASVDIQTTSSLPSSPPPAATAEDGPNELPSRRAEQPRSPAFSTTSTAEGGSSPVLPPLPPPTFRGHTIDILSTPPSGSGSQAGSSHYYTASWGSPYQTATAASFRTRSHGRTLSSEASEDSPIRHLEFHTPYLRPAPTFTRSQTEPDFVSQDGLISAAVLANRARRPATGLTEEWIRHHTGGEAAERNHWLSDDPGDSEHSSLSGSISGESRDWLGQEADPLTPTLKRFLQSRKFSRVASNGHKRGPSTETLKQEYFDHSVVKMSSVNENPESAVEMEMQISSPAEERAPPPPPKSPPLSWRAAALPAPTSGPAPSEAPSSPQRLKKKVPWKGKNILVLLPWDDQRGQKGNAPKPMSESEVDAMLKEWEQLGYDTTGFNLGPSDAFAEEGAQGQSRSVWPTTQDMLRERGQRTFRVSIPDRSGKFIFHFVGHSFVKFLTVIFIPYIPT